MDLIIFIRKWWSKLFWNQLLHPLTYPVNTSIFVPVTWLPPDHHTRKFSVHEYLGVHHMLLTEVCALRVLLQFTHVAILCLFSFAMKIICNFLFFNYTPESFPSVLFDRALQAERLLEQEEEKKRWFGNCVHFGTEQLGVNGRRTFSAVRRSFIHRTASFNFV